MVGSLSVKSGFEIEFIALSVPTLRDNSMKLTCIIDACSYIYLDECDFRATIGENDYSLLNLLDHVVTIKYSHEVSREISRHLSSTSVEVLARSNKIHAFRKLTEAEYEQKLVAKVLSYPSHNKGELDNLAVVIDLFLMGKTGLVFLTDDDNALRGCLRELLPAFPICQVWSSLDAVLFLYLNLYQHKKFQLSCEAAKEAIVDLLAYKFKQARKEFEDSRISMSPDEYALKVQKLNKDVDDQKFEYFRHLDKISHLLGVNQL